MAEELGVPVGRYKHWEYKTQPPADVMRKAEALVAGQPSTGPDLDRPGKTIPLMEPVAADRIGLWSVQDGHVTVPEEFSRDNYAGLLVDGHAPQFLPLIHPNDLLVVRQTRAINIGRLSILQYRGEPQLRLATVGTQAFQPEQPAPGAPNASLTPPGDWESRGVLVGLLSGDGVLKIGPVDDGFNVHFLVSLFGSRLTHNGG